MQPGKGKHAVGTGFCVPLNIHDPLMGCHNTLRRDFWSVNLAGSAEQNQPSILQGLFINSEMGITNMFGGHTPCQPLLSLNLCFPLLTLHSSSRRQNCSHFTDEENEA